MWEVFRDGTLAELANIPEARWDYRPGEGARSLRELALHIAVSGIGFTAELLAPETSFMRLRDPYVQAEMMARYSTVESKQDIIDLLKTSMTEGAKSLREEADMLSKKTMVMLNAEQSRITGIWFAAAHEMYHRGQLATYARGMGLVPAMTQRLQAPRK